jgi:hypothetical protein
VRVYVPGHKHPTHENVERCRVTFELDGLVATIDVEVHGDHILVTMAGRVTDWPNGPDEVFKVVPE